MREYFVELVLLKLLELSVYFPVITHVSINARKHTAYTGVWMF